MTPDEIMTLLRKRGFRNTENREYLLALLFETKKPLEADLVLQKLQRRFKKQIHKATVYRELNILHQEGVVREVVFGDRKKRYELASRPHHHHLVCKKCKRIQDVQMKDDLEKAEKRIFHRKGFSVSYHSLEFFGLCAMCNTTTI